MAITPRRLLVGVLLLIAVGIIAMNRFSGGTAPAGRAAQPQTTAVESAAAGPASAAAPPPPAASSSTPADDDHEHDGPSDDEPPVMAGPTEKPDVKESATAFAAAWLNTYRATPAAWRARLLDRMTPQLAADMADADPASVPEGGKVGNPVKVIKDGTLLSADVPVVTAGTNKPQPLGTLRLTFVQTDNGDWLVSEIDLEEKQ